MKDEQAEQEEGISSTASPSVSSLCSLRPLRLINTNLGTKAGGFSRPNTSESGDESMIGVSRSLMAFGEGRDGAQI